jgi:hypothetical protein
VNYFTRDRKGRKVLPQPPYGIHVAGVVPDQNALSLALTLRAGQWYCCSTARCGFSPQWDELRRWLAEAGIEMGYPMRIRFRENRERGALIAVDPADLSTCQPVEEAWDGEEYVIDESEPNSSGSKGDG